MNQSVDLCINYDASVPFSKPDTIDFVEAQDDHRRLLIALVCRIEGQP